MDTYDDLDDSDEREPVTLDSLDDEYHATTFSAWIDARLTPTRGPALDLEDALGAYSEETGQGAPLPDEALDELAQRFEISGTGAALRIHARRR